MKAVAILLKIAFIGVIAASYEGLWPLWTVAFWATGAGFVFAFANRYNWYVTKGGCDLFGVGILLLAILELKSISTNANVLLVVNKAIPFFLAYFAIISLYHIAKIARGQGYKFPIAVVISKFLFKHTYLGVENVKGE